MLILLLIILIILMFATIICCDDLSIIPGVFVIAVFVDIIALVISAVAVVNARTVDAKIAMYEEENQQIEEQIDDLVKQYMEYEAGVFANTTKESSITLVSLYPELKADELVSTQLSIYVENNEKIKGLKMDKLNVSSHRWWLYFGK